MLINDHTSADAGNTPDFVPLFWWQGWSTRWYLTSVFNLKGFSCREAGLFVVVRREGDGQCTPLMVGMADSVSDDLYGQFGDALLRAIKAGATEVHVHLAEADTMKREAAMEDIAAGWQMPMMRPVVYA
ncbi:hypothetical protein L1787_23835 [Acuticoccus sp. M5D2P5]|uniref:hypothetical protein n=1 Tax=Acuticoccus kalidii TaxID=2910977 RepID=UPI001F1FF7FA|nr:hypothetical protein [Acuticoccus kalidii]MCF3936429.1 hypothetical protein [Acuticoccus kalidii]